MDIIFVRHGQTDWNAEKKIQGKKDIPLNDCGKNQALEVAKKLKTFCTNSTSIYSSAKLRAVTTADIIKNYCNLKNLQQIKEFNEMDFGDWEGLTFEEIKSKFPKDFSLWHDNRRETRVINGECYNDVLKRVFSKLKDLVKIENGDFVVVTHAGIILALLSFINKTPFENMAKLYDLSPCDFVKINSVELLAAEN